MRSCVSVVWQGDDNAEADNVDNAEADNVDDEDLDAVLGAPAINAVVAANVAALPANPFGVMMHANAVHIGAIA